MDQHLGCGLWGENPRFFGNIQMWRLSLKGSVLSGVRKRQKVMWISRFHHRILMYFWWFEMHKTVYSQPCKNWLPPPSPFSPYLHPHLHAHPYDHHHDNNIYIYNHHQQQFFSAFSQLLVGVRLPRIREIRIILWSPCDWTLYQDASEFSGSCYEFSNNSKAFYPVHSGKLRKQWKNGPFEDVFSFPIESETYSMWFQIFFYVHPFFLEKTSNLTHIFQRGWFNHQLDK